jgi:hypothetical protein
MAQNKRTHIEFWKLQRIIEFLEPAEWYFINFFFHVSDLKKRRKERMELGSKVRD